MKKVVLILISMMLVCPVANSFSIPFTDKKVSVKIQKTDKKTTKKEKPKSKAKPKPGDKGYYGKVPNINSEFGNDRQESEQKENNAPIILNKDSFNVDKKDMAPSLIKNDKYLDVIMKRDKTSNFVNDLNELVPILEKMRAYIEQEKDIQKFNAVVSNYIDNVAYIEKKYKNSPESNYIAFMQIKKLAEYTRKVAITRTEAVTYNKYLAYEEGNGVYSPQNIKNLLESTLLEIENTLEAIEETK